MGTAANDIGQRTKEQKEERQTWVKGKGDILWKERKSEQQTTRRISIQDGMKEETKQGN